MRIKVEVKLNIPTSEVITTNIIIDDYDIKDMTDQAKFEYIEDRVKEWKDRQIVTMWEVFN